jgi:hypothetical protein
MLNFLFEGATAGADDVSESGWSNSQKFFNYIKEHLSSFCLQGMMMMMTYFSSMMYIRVTLPLGGPNLVIFICLCYHHIVVIFFKHLM